MDRARQCYEEARGKGVVNATFNLGPAPAGRPRRGLRRGARPHSLPGAGRRRQGPAGRRRQGHAAEGLLSGRRAEADAADADALFRRAAEAAALRPAARSGAMPPLACDAYLVRST